MPNTLLPDARKVPLRWTLTLLIASILAPGCGGGGSAEGQPAAAQPSTALAAFRAPAQIPQNFRAPGSMPTSQIAASEALLPRSDGPTYLKVWFTDPATGEPRTLSFGRFNRGALLPTLQAPMAVTTVHYEVYNAGGSETGRWELQ